MNINSINNKSTPITPTSSPITLIPEINNSGKENEFISSIKNEIKNIDFNFKDILLNPIDAVNETLKNPEIQKRIDELEQNITYKIDNINNIKDKIALMFTINLNKILNINLKNILIQKLNEIREIIKNPEIMNILLDIGKILPITVKTFIKSAADQIQQFIVNIEFDLSFIKNNNLKEIIKYKINELVELTKDPYVKHDLKELMREVGGYGSIAIASAMPEIKKIIPEILDLLGKSAIKLSNTMVKLLLNMGTTVPVVGPVIGTIKVVDNGVTTIKIILETNLEIIKKLSDKFNVIANRFVNIIEKKNASLNNSINQLPPQNTIPPTIPPISSPRSLNQLGGSIKKANKIKARVNKSIARFHKKNKSITRRHLKK
jgi:hypothetical protein